MKKITVFAFLTLFSISIFAQKSKILLTVGNEKVTSDEFLHIYKKNNSDELNKQSVDEYLELFKNFKLKVVEAESLKMDTSKAFINELSGYRDQLAKPYLIENIKYDELVDEAYKRNQIELKLDIIFLKLAKSASPEDTLKMYEKALDIRKRILEGEDFEKVAVENSEDRLVAKNKGHLSYLPVLRIPYAIQSYAFSDNKHTLSLPIRTEYGYYLVRLIDTRPAQGFVKVAHIMISSTDQMSDEEKAVKKNLIDSLYNRITAGDKFEDLLKYSDDKGTAKKGGELPEFSTGRMVPEFETTAFNLKNTGDISEPVLTSFGWHIIKLIETFPPKSKEEQKENIKKTIERDPERKLMIENFVKNKLKDELNFSKNSGPDAFYSIVDSSIYKGAWKFQADKLSNKVLFSINKVNYTENQFGKYIADNQKKIKKESIQNIINNMYDEFIFLNLTETEKSGLEDKYKEFKYLMQEYHDGMLLFDLMKKEIWDKASEDTVGLKKYYDDNIETYQNQNELDISVFTCKNKETHKETIRLLTNEREKYTDSLLVKYFSENLSIKESGVFSKGQSIYADKVFRISEESGNDKKIIDLSEDNIIIYINSKRKSKPKKFDEIKGVIIADYQNYLEKMWMNDLKNKYKIVVNQKVLNKVKKSVE